MLKLKALSMLTRRWRATKLVLATGFALGIAALVSNGPLLQETLISLFDVSNVSLYESVVPDGIALDRGPKRWISAAFELPWLITAIFASLLAVQMKGWRRMLIVLALGVAAGLTILDTVYGTIYGQVTIDDFLINGFANVLGGLSIGLFFFFVLWISLFLCKAMGFRREHQEVVTAIAAAALGFGMSLILYVAIALILQPVEVKARVLAKLPVAGVIGKTSARDGTGKENNSFRFIGTRSEVDQVTLNGTQALEWEWMPVEGDTQFSVVVYIVGGCTDLEQVKMLAKHRSIADVENVERMHIVADGLINEIAIAGQQIGVSVERGPVSQFWIDGNESGNGVDLTEFLSDGTTILGKTDGHLDFFLTALTAQHSEGQDAVHRVPRTFELQINDEKIPIVFTPGMQIDAEDTLNCRNLEQGSATAYENVALAGLYAEIKRTEAPRHYWVSFDGKYEFQGVTGWLRRSNVPHRNLRSVAAEELGMIVISTPIKELFVNGERHEIPIGVGFRGHGETRASYDEISGLTFSGTFHAAWLGTQRINRTALERWSFEVKMALLTALASIGGAIVTLVYRTREIWKAYL